MELILPLLFAVAVAQVEEPQSIGIESVFSAWRVREQVQSARIRWDATMFVAANSTALPNGDTQPTNDLSREVKDLQLELKAGNTRYDRVLTDFDAWSRGAQLPKILTTFDGTDSMMWNSPTSIGEHPEGAIYNASAYKDAGSGDAGAVFLMYRATSPAGFDLRENDFTIQAKSVEFDSDKCVVLRGRNAVGLEREIWVVPAKDFVVRRFIEFHMDGSGPYYELEVDYRKGDLAGWIPDSWEASFYLGHGRLASSVKAQVREWTTNCDLPASRFRIDFPVGTVVYDEKQELKYRIEQDGTRTILSPKPALTDSGTTGRSILLLVNLLIVLGLLVVFCVKRLRRKPNSK